SYIMLPIAAMTRFYMFRLYFLVFSGESRADEQVKHHIHESPPVMTVPLVVLAVLAALGGLFGTPWKDLFGEFLGSAPELHAPWAMMGLGTVAFLVVLGGAYVCYFGGVRQPVVTFVRALPWLHKLVKNKFYVDELYDLLFVRTTRVLARTMASFFDKFIIDTVLVGGVARMVDAVGYVVRRLQNGDVQRYVAAMVIGAAVLLGEAPRPPVEFEVQTSADGVEVHVVKKGKSGAQRHLRYCWKVDGEEGCRSDKPQDSLQVGPGEHKVTLRVEDADWGTS